MTDPTLPDPPLDFADRLYGPEPAPSSATSIAELQAQMLAEADRQAHLPEGVILDAETVKQRARDAAALRRQLVQQLKLANREKAMDLRTRKVVGWFERTDRLRSLIIRDDKGVSVYDAHAKSFVGHVRHSGVDYHFTPKVILRLEKPLKAGPIAIHFERNPEAIHEQSPKGFTARQLAKFWQLAEAVAKANRDGLNLTGAWKWGLIGLVVVGLVASAWWLYSRGVFG